MIKEFLRKNKEIIISISIIIIIVIVLFCNYRKQLNKERTIIYNEESEKIENIESEQLDNIAKEGSYIFKNEKLFITFKGEEIEVPGDFSNLNELEEETYQISDFKMVFYNHNYKNDNSFIVFSDDNGQNWDTVQLNPNEEIQYIEFFSKDIGVMYEILDVAMTDAFGNIKVTNDGGKNWNVVSKGINDIFKLDSKVKFYTKDLGYFTMPYNGGDSCELYYTLDQGKTFQKVEVPHLMLEDTDLLWEDIYDYYNMPTIKDNVYYLEVSQGADGDYNGGNSINYYSYTGFDWNNKEIDKKSLEQLHTQFNERVANRSDKIFLKEFENYKPESNEIKISQKEAEKIAEIGFEEADTIGESGDKESQIMRIEERNANNFFIMDFGCKERIYNDIVRKCYVFIRENSLGNGAMVFVDVTTGLIIGGECFGD